MRKLAKNEKKYWIVTMRCIVTKSVEVSDCTFAEAQNNPWDHADNEMEVEQIDWKILKIEENK